MNEARSVLLVDDDALVREAIRQVIEEELAGWRVLEATNGSEGVALALSHRPDVIVLDYHMPVMNGYQMALALKAQEATRTIPLVLCSSAGVTDVEITPLLRLCAETLEKATVYKRLVRVLVQVTTNGVYPVG